MTSGASILFYWKIYAKFHLFSITFYGDKITSFHGWQLASLANCMY
jgi:hypothetical protein